MAKRFGLQPPEEVLITKSTASGGMLDIVNTQGDEWDLVVTLVPSDTENLKARDYCYSCTVRHGFGFVTTVAAGVFQVTPTMIRP